MSSASASSHGFVTVRRGYRPEQADAYVLALSGDRDAAWERAARLTVLAKDMAAQAVALREAVAQLVPQSYESLGERAQCVLRLAREEAAEVRESARSAAEERVAREEARGADVLRVARECAEVGCAEAEERARQRLGVARAAADELRIGARREVKELRGESLGVLREARRRSEETLAGQAEEQAGRWADVEREAVEQGVALDARHAELVARAEAALAKTRQDFKATEAAAGRCQEEARARAAEILAEARVREERIARETERVLREHQERWDDVRAHMDHMRDSLMSLTGRPAAE